MLQNNVNTTQYSFYNVKCFRPTEMQKGVLNKFRINYDAAAIVQMLMFLIKV